VGAPTRIGISTGGYRRGDSNPGKVCIATSGYRCLELVVAGIKARTQDKFNDLTDYIEQAKREDEELLVICRGLIEIVCR
jgi:hypothetical protein